MKADDDFAFFISEIRDVPGKVLELMAGTGRLSIPLLEAGAQLTCVDAAAGMLSVLSRKLWERNLEAETYCMDVRHLTLEERFSMAILPFQALMEIVDPEDQALAIRSIYQCLEPGGRFICTLHNPAIRRASVDGVLRIASRELLGDGSLVVSGFERGGDPVVERVQLFEHFGPDGRMRWKREQPMRFAMIEKDDFERMSAAAGFRVAAWFGGYDRRALDLESSPVMISILEKPAA